MSIDVVFKCLEIIFDRKAVIRKGVPQASSAMQCNNTLKVGKPSVEKKKTTLLIVQIIYGRKIIYDLRNSDICSIYEVIMVLAFATSFFRRTS